MRIAEMCRITDLADGINADHDSKMMLWDTGRSILVGGSFGLPPASLGAAHTQYRERDARVPKKHFTRLTGVPMAIGPTGEAWTFSSMVTSREDAHPVKAVAPLRSNNYASWMPPGGLPLGAAEGLMGEKD
jgi:hypothetical protein